MEFSDTKKFQGIFLFVDFEKAFDTLEWNFILKTLEAFNFGDNFKKMGFCSLQQRTKLCHEWWIYDQLFRNIKRSSARVSA